jgi:hypothetical protein
MMISHSWGMLNAHAEESAGATGASDTVADIRTHGNAVC